MMVCLASRCDPDTEYVRGGDLVSDETSGVSNLMIAKEFQSSFGVIPCHVYPVSPKDPNKLQDVG